MSEYATPGGSAQAPRLGIGVVGAGKVGPVLAAAWRSAGHQVLGISVTDQDSEDRAEALLPGVPHLSVTEILRRSEAVLLALPAPALEDVVAGGAATHGWQTGQLVIHTCPTQGIDALTPAAEAGAIPLAIHPLTTFTGTSMDVAHLNGARAAVAAPKLMAPVGLALAVELGCEPFVLDDEDRPLYAAGVAAATGSFSASLAYAWEALSAVGVDEPSSALSPLVRSKVESALIAGPDAGSSFARTLSPDQVEITRSGWSRPDAPEGAHGLYVALARAAITRALARNEIGANQAAAVLDALA